jgi:diguanylate cyclase (GGDEF)-like protein
MQAPIKILIIDDDELDRMSVVRALNKSSQSIEFHEASNESAALHLLHEHKYDCLLLDYRLGISDGLTFLKHVQQNRLSLAPVIMLSGLDDEEVMLECLKEGAQDYLLKSELTSNVLMRAVRYAQERKQVAEKLRYIAHHDGLTGLSNRSLFLSNISQAMARAKRAGNLISVFFIDLDHFKEVNDTLGHDAGDDLLKQMAERIKGSVRGSDMVSRFGGDEFAVLISDIHQKTDVIAIAEKTVEAVGAVFKVKGSDIHITPSIGIAMYPGTAETAEDIVQFADMAMYHAKKGGRNSYSFYAKEMLELVINHTRLKAELTAALKNGEFELYYQPQYDAAAGMVRGAEALLRWNHPERGLVSPAEFIPVAEETGLIVPIGEWVLETACSQLETWRRQNKFNTHNFSLSVNVSAYQLKQNNITSLVEKAVGDKGFANNQLVLELTESMLIDDISRCAQTLERITRLGVRIAIDDFGTGFSSFRHLLSLPLSYLKIDKSFVDNIVGDKKNAEIVTAIIAMARALELQVIAEGVEEQCQVDQLVASGCTLQQGYHYSRPVPAHKAVRWFGGKLLK